jgi:hypothetical protein
MTNQKEKTDADHHEEDMENGNHVRYYSSHSLSDVVATTPTVAQHPATASSSNNDAPEKKNGNLISDNGNDNDDNCADIIITVAHLPPLPKPDRVSIRRETIGGTVVVLLFVAIFVSLTHGVALTAVGTITKNSVAHAIFSSLIYAQACIGIMCLLGVQYINPGVIPRTPETCFPVPPTMRAWVQENRRHPSLDDSRTTSIQSPQQQQQQQNRTIYVNKKEIAVTNSLAGDSNTSRDAKQSISSPSSSSDRASKLPPTAVASVPHYRPSELYIAGADGRVYCTRCLVWRQPGINHFHCGTCQRCVSYYDHHCTFFGRCIAGKLLHIGRRSGGNYFCFVTILIDAVAACLTTVAALMYSLSLKYGPEWVVPIGALGMVCLYSCMMRRSPAKMCMFIRQIAVGISELARRGR